jgi:hypothetical protein
MRFLGMLGGVLLLPACGDGTGGIVMPAPLDLTRIERPQTLSITLATSSGFKLEPDIINRGDLVPSGRLYVTARAMADQGPFFLLKAYDEQNQAHFAGGTALTGFPDLIAMSTFQNCPEWSVSALWSPRACGRSGLGVSRKRVTTWIAALDMRVVH